MNISSPSFGHKIPITKAKIENTEKGKFERATVYKVDAKEEKDVLEYSRLEDDWFFKDAIADDIQIDQVSKKGKLPKHNYYLIKDSKRQTVGIAETMEFDDETELKYISTQPHTKYKYVGQTLLASIAQETQHKTGQDLTITTAADSAYDFYTDICGFEQERDNLLRMKNLNLPKFIHQTEKRIQAPIIDCKG